MPRECVFYAAVYPSSDRGVRFGIDIFVYLWFWMGVHFHRDRASGGHATHHTLTRYAFAAYKLRVASALSRTDAPNLRLMQLTL